MNRSDYNSLPGVIHVGTVLALLTLLWLAFGGNDWAAVFVGVPTVLLALTAALWLSPSWDIRINLLAFALFIPEFLKLSLAGGIDVARRSLSPELRLDPELMSYDLRLSDGTPRYFFALLISLLPGTLSAELEGDRLTVHVLDRHLDNHAALERLEKRIAQIFRVPIEETREGEA